jgi:hypothetical protein
LGTLPCLTRPRVSPLKEDGGEKRAAEPDVAPATTTRRGVRRRTRAGSPHHSKQVVRIFIDRGAPAARLTAGTREIAPCIGCIPTRRVPSENKRLADQEQIQMIVIAIGTPKPSALRIAKTNSDSKFARGRTPGSDMTLLLGAPRASARPQDERSIASSDQDPDGSSITGMLRGYG